MSLPLQEGHTAHATAPEAEEEAMRFVRLYEDFAGEAQGRCFTHQMYTKILHLCVRIPADSVDGFHTL